MLPGACGSAPTPRSTAASRSLRYLLPLRDASSSAPPPSVELCDRPSLRAHAASPLVAFPRRTGQILRDSLYSCGQLKSKRADSTTAAVGSSRTSRCVLAKPRVRSAFLRLSCPPEEVPPACCRYRHLQRSPRRLSTGFQALEAASSFPSAGPFSEENRRPGSRRRRLASLRCPLSGSCSASFDSAPSAPSCSFSSVGLPCRRASCSSPCLCSLCRAGATGGQRWRALGTHTATRPLSTAAVDSVEGAARSVSASSSPSASSTSQKGPVLSATLRQAFPYVMPVFRPLHAIKQLPEAHESSARKALELRTLSVRLAHALLPPFSADTEELWCTYTRRLLGVPSVSSLKEDKRKGESRGDTEQPVGHGQAGQEVVVPVSLGLQIARLFASRNVILSESWRLLFGALDPVLVDLQRTTRRRGLQQQQPTQTGTERGMRDANEAALVSESEDAEGEQADKRSLEETIIRLCESANRVRHDWRWGIAALMDYAKRQLPLLDVSQAAR